MIFGGIQKNSLIDYPSKVSCVLFTQGCNFRCPYCHNPQLVASRSTRSPVFEQDVFAFLSKRKNWLDGVVISGGEPTIQDDLFDFCGRIKDMGFAVKLDTNGSRPQVVEKLIRLKRVDYIAMDMKTDPDRYVPVIAKAVDPALIRASAHAILASGLAHEFRTTCVKSIVDAESIRAIGVTITGAVRYVLQQVQCLEGHVLNPNYFKTHDWHLDGESISALRDIAAGFVEACTIRWTKRV
ncbi:MAG: anaerobic ribonucleoside-triphosphate reductase activating protein [Desulfobacteraceae bacterium]|jgi:pyruvate formate lyase activating enzyme|nr:MAG: anaerobic ribonucleoside-triphosphate reductase activating protein [Desulfobacteraceae bacterium]